MAYTEVVDKQILWKAPFKRDEAFPLDRSSVFTSYDEMEDYAKATKENPHSKGIPYVGQVVAVSDANGVKVYSIENVGETPSFKSLEAQYSEGLGIDINDNNEITVKIANPDDAGYENFIEKDNFGLSVKSINTNKTVTSSAIRIEGGPLANDEIKEAFKIETENGETKYEIPAETSIQEILRKLLCVEKYPAVNANTPSFTVSITPPSIKTSVGNSGVLVEVGSSILFNEIKANSVSITTTDPKVSTFTYGYSDTINGEIINKSAISVTWDVDPMPNEVYVLSATTIGFTGQVPEKVSNADNELCKLPATSFIANFGENKYSVTESAPKQIGTHGAIGKKYIVSNLGGRDEKYKSPSIDADNGSEKTVSSKTSNFIVNGVYPIYSNIKNNGFISDASEKFDLQTGTTFTIENIPTEVDSANNFMFDYPETKSITNFETVDVQGKFVPFGGFYNAKSREITKTINGKDYKYYRLTTGGGNGPSGKYRITLSDSLNKE